MRSSDRVLEENLARLLPLYVPVRPSEKLVARLEGRLAPWLGERAAPPKSRTAWIVAAVAAAALFLFAFAALFSGTRERGGAAGELPVAHVRVREDGAAWRDASAEELARGLAWRDRELVVHTAAQQGIRLSSLGAWSVELEPRTRLVARPASEGVRFELFAGAASVGGELFRAPISFRWGPRGFSVEDPLGKVSVTRQPAEPGEASRAGVEESTPAVEAATAATLRGVVLDGARGTPHEDFEVSVLRAVPLPQVAEPETTRFEASSGAFELAGLAPGEYTLFIQVEGRALWKRGGLKLEAGSSVEVEARTEAGVTVRGFVVDRDRGGAVAGALVVAERDFPAQVVSLTVDEFPETARAFTLTGADGSFRLEGLSSGEHRLRASGEGHAPSWTEPFVLDPARESDALLIELGPGGGVRGRVEHADGSPRVGARVVVSRFDPGSGPGTMTYRGLWTDAEGRYEARALAPGFYVVLNFGEVSAERDHLEPEYSSVFVHEGEVVEVDFRATPRGARVHGLVLDAAGRPIVGANLQLHAGGGAFRAAVSDAEGRYEIHTDRPGRYWLFAGTGDSAVRVAVLELEAGASEERDVTLAGARLELRLSDGHGGGVVRGATLALFPSEAAGGPRIAGFQDMIARTWRGSAGLYAFEDLLPGTYDVFVSAESAGLASCWLEGVRVEGEGASRAALELEPGGAARVEVVDEDGAPLEGVTVELTHPSERLWCFFDSTLTDEEGVLEVRGLAAGTWGAIVSAPGRARTQLELPVDPGGQTVRRVVLPRH